MHFCYLCGGALYKNKAFTYAEPDKYEQSVGVPGGRSWWECPCCGLREQIHRYDRKDLIWQVYEQEYRGGKLRTEPIREAFERIVKEGDENYARVAFFIGRSGLPEKRHLDIGSGLGIFPNSLIKYGYHPTCIEPNIDSVDFINNELGIKAIQGFFDPKLIEDRFASVSAIHVLEHVEDPKAFLIGCKEVLNPDGKLFIEVPDAVEFDYLPAEHDEFNSCHLWFFDTASLYRLVTECGFNVTDIRRVRTEQRDLSRIMLFARKQ